MNPRKYNFAMNDPFDMDADIKLVLPKLMSSNNFMKSIKRFEVNKNSIAIWPLGQNGFIIKDNDGTLVCIDPYLSNFCEETRNQKKIKFKLDRNKLSYYNKLYFGFFVNHNIPAWYMHVYKICKFVPRMHVLRAGVNFFSIRFFYRLSLAGIT